MSRKWNLIFWKRADKDDEVRAAINDIYDLKQKLVDLGFEADEVEYIIHDNADQKRLSQWDLPTTKKIMKALEAQLSIGKGCLELVQKKNLPKKPKVERFAES